MLDRRYLFKSAAVAVLGLFPSRFVLGQRGGVQVTGAQGTRSGVAPLRDQLTQGLRVVTKEQADFVNVVVAFVDARQISTSMVNSVYKWALKRNPRVPFPYFQYALRALAARRGVTLPNQL